MKVAVGGVLGGLVGFLFRPSVPLVGQLPAMVVLTGGEYLRGLDRLFVPTAQTSLAYVIGGAIVGVMISAAIRGKSSSTMSLRDAFSTAEPVNRQGAQRSSSARQPEPQPEPVYQPPAHANYYQPVAPFCPNCRAYFMQGAPFCAMCGYRRAL